MNSATAKSETFSSYFLVRLYAVYKLLLSLLFVALFTTDAAPELLGSRSPDVFLFTAIGYFGLSLLTLLVFGLGKVQLGSIQVFFILLTDIVALTLLTDSSGGVTSGIGYLMLICIAAGGMLLRGQLAVLLAATASVCIILSSFSGLIGESQDSASVFQSGLLGALLFITAMSSRLLQQRLQTAQREALERKQAAAQLQQLNEHIIRSMQTGIIVVDHQGIIQLINHAAVVLLGGQPGTSDFNPGARIRRAKELYGQLQRWQNFPWLRTEPFQEKQGSQEVQANFTVLHQGHEEQILIFLEDTRTLAQHAQTIKQSSLSRLTGSIAHEIRNPLGAISHASQLLNELDTNNQVGRLCQIIKKQSDRVNQLVENVMHLSRQQTPNLRNLDLPSWLERFCRDYQDNANVDCMVEYSVENVSQVVFDPSHLAQIISNLVDNALPYSHQLSGEYWSRLRAFVDQQSGLPFLDIQDKGPGIPQEVRDKIFEPFFTTRHTGSGLGLYVCRELCELNFSSLNYITNEDGTGFFRIGFPHPKRLLPGHNHDSTQSTDC